MTEGLLLPLCPPEGGKAVQKRVQKSKPLSPDGGLSGCDSGDDDGAGVFCDPIEGNGDPDFSLGNGGDFAVIFYCGNGAVGRGPYNIRIPFSVQFGVIWDSPNITDG